MTAIRGIAAASLGCLALLAGSADAGGATYRWGTKHVRVCDRSGYRPVLSMAIDWWNRTPASVRLSQSCSNPQIVVYRYSRDTPHKSGFAYYPPDGRTFLNHYWMGRMGRTQRADTVAHELGHALGLPHLRGCAVMYGGPGFGSHCHESPGRSACGPQRHDARALIRLYGGRLGGFRGYSCGTPAPPEVVATETRR